MRSAGATAALVVFLCFVLNMLGRGVADSYTVFLLPLGAEFGWNRAQVASVYSIYLIVTGLAGPLTGMAFDRWGPRVVYPVGLLALGIGNYLAAALTQLWQFYLCVGLLGGIGVSALGMIPASSLIRRWFRRNLSTAIALAYAGFGSGVLLVVPFTQHLINAQGWRDTYRILGGTLLVLVPFMLLLPWKRIAAGDAEVVRRSGADATGAMRRSFATVLRTREYWLLAQVFAFTALAMHAVIVQAVAYLVDAGFPPIEAATAFGVAGFLSVVGMVSSGWLADRIGFRATATASFVLTFLGIVMLVVLSLRPAPWALFAFVLLFGLSQGARGPIVSTLAARLFPGPGFGVVFGTMFACMSIGAGVGSWVSGLLHDLTGGYLAGFAWSLVCVLIAAAPFWTSDRLHR